ncbi:membrane dipeptidase [Streptomyces genisteinicus]|uniref:Membrane dipeptidase n=1 Tax=Streptomyces genisteinicus TaxID=2768068 RepID=A0A7H0HSX5_9ACTN|nr:membrane dipeptidase [Streptomyces genisteinicus]QNP63641.1 membrane dipeptidase [Streptomyces genisteinicus]
MAEPQDATFFTTADLRALEAIETIETLGETDGAEAPGQSAPPGRAGSAGQPGGPGADGPGRSAGAVRVTTGAAGADSLARAEALLRTHPVVDGRSGLAPVLRSMHFHDLEAGETLLETDVPRLRRGRVGAQFWSLHPPAGADPTLADVLELLDLVRATTAATPEGLLLAAAADDLVDARNRGRTAVLPGPAPGQALGDSLAALRALHALGVRSVTLAGTRWAGERGLTPLGHEMIREMNRLGVVADLSGSAPETVRRVLAVSRVPAIVSHPPEPLPEDVLRALRASGGVCMVPCTPGTPEETAEALERVREAAGPETVALTGAWDTGLPHAPGLADVACFPGLVALLLERGWPEADVTALTWSNMMRVLREAEFAARAAATRESPSRATIDTLGT